MRRPRLGVVVALAWIFTALAVTAWLGPRLGLRGWGWLLLHDLLCAVGAGSELWRQARRSRRLRDSWGVGASATPQGPSTR